MDAHKDTDIPLLRDLPGFLGLITKQDLLSKQPFFSCLVKGRGWSYR